MAQNTIKELQKYFDVRELVSKDIYNKFGQNAWQVFDEKLLATLLVLRTEILCVPLVCNNWKAGGSFTQRGFRENVCGLVAYKTKAGQLYVSAHSIGKGVDLTSPKMDAETMRQTIEKEKSKLPYPVRIERGVSWLHIDTMTLNTEKITYFDA